MGIKRNFLFSTVLTASNYIFPFIIYPYVARVLGVANIGICNFVDGIVNYAVMVSSMGIAVVGVREIAKAKGDRHQLDTTFTALFTLCALFTMLATAGLVGATYLFDELYAYRKMLFIGVLKLWSTFLLIDWLYRGLEDFKYITVRTIAVKTAYLASVFIFIHRPDDYVVYYLLMSLMVTVNAVINCWKAAQLISLRWDTRALRSMLRPFMILGIYILLNSMYTTFNVIYLGLKWDDVEVGYYTTATKIFTILLAIYTAYSGVVMPRVSALLSEGKTEEFRILISKSVDALILIAVPAVIFTMMYSKGIVEVIAGSQYGGAVIPMMIVMPLIFIIGYEQILVVQTLTPLSTDRIILFNSVIGASVGIIGNLALVGSLAAIGSAIVWVMAEIAVLIAAQYFVTVKVGLRFPWRALTSNIAAYIPYILINWSIIQYLPLNPIVQMFVGGVICGIYFVVIQRSVLHNELFSKYYDKIASKIISKLR